MVTDGDCKTDVFGLFAINYDNSTGLGFSAEQATQNAGIVNVGCGTFCRAGIAGQTNIIFIHELGHNFNLAYAGSDPRKTTVALIMSTASTATPAAKQPYQSSADSRKEKHQAKRQARQEQRAKKKAVREESKAKERAAKEEQKPEKNKADVNP